MHIPSPNPCNLTPSPFHQQMLLWVWERHCVYLFAVSVCVCVCSGSSRCSCRVVGLQSLPDIAPIIHLPYLSLFLFCSLLSLLLLLVFPSNPTSNITWICHFIICRETEYMQGRGGGGGGGCMEIWLSTVAILYIAINSVQHVFLSTLM